jgi:hypothetical protein
LGSSVFNSKSSGAFTTTFFASGCGSNSGCGCPFDFSPYYRCSRKSHQPCNEPYVREESVILQSQDKLRPLGLSTTEAAELRQVVETEAKNELQSLVKSIEAIDAQLEPLETQHRNLRRLVLNGTFSEEEYRDSKEELVVEQTRLKQEKHRLQKTRENSWIEPTRDLVNTLDIAGKSNVSESLPELARLVQKIGTNHLISRKTVSFSISELYEKIPDLLRVCRLSRLHSHGATSAENGQRSKWCTQ